MNVHTTLEGYVKEEYNAINNLNLHHTSKLEGDKATKQVKELITGRKGRSRVCRLRWMNGWSRRRAFRGKNDNAQKAKGGIVEEVFAIHKNILGEEVRPYWAQLVTEMCFTPGWKNDRAKCRVFIIDTHVQLSSWSHVNGSLTLYSEMTMPNSSACTWISTSSTPNECRFTYSSQ